MRATLDAEAARRREAEKLARDANVLRHRAESRELTAHAENVVRQDPDLATMLALEAVRRENQELKKKLESRKLVDRAKALLIQRLGLSEAEAYRRLQKTAMDTRKTMGDVAQGLLVSDEMSHLRPIKH